MPSARFLMTFLWFGRCAFKFSAMLDCDLLGVIFISEWQDVSDQCPVLKNQIFQPFKITARLSDMMTNRTAQGQQPLSSTVSWNSNARAFLISFCCVKDILSWNLSLCLRKYKGQLPTGGALPLHPLCSMYSRNSLEGFFWEPHPS